MFLSDHRNSPRLARDALVLGPSAALNRDPTTTPSVNDPTQQSYRYVFHNNPQHLNLHAWCLGADNSKNKASLWRWQRIAAPQRSSTRTIYKSSGPYLKMVQRKFGGFLHSICETNLRFFHVPVPRPKQAPLDL